MKRIVIAQARLHHFRVPFYEQLRRVLIKEGIELILIYGQPKRDESAKKDSGDLEWAHKVKNRYLHIGKIELLWQPYLLHLRRGDVVVVQQENRMIINYVLLFLRKLMGIKVAFWGHGINCQAENRHGLREKWKKIFIKAPDWWFAYTDFTRDILVGSGYSESKITVVNNAVDTSKMRKWKSEILPSEVEVKKRELNIQTDCVGVYCGSLYSLKRMPFLVETALVIRRSFPDFELLIIGDGEDRPFVESVASQHSWIHYVGPQRGRDQILHLMLAKVFMIPSGVGLAVVDSMIMGLPMITTRSPGHGPEIAYLKNGENGIITDDDVKPFSEAAIALLSDAGRLSVMVDKCRILSANISVEEMVDNFVKGAFSLLENS